MVYHWKVYIHRALRTIGQHSIESNIVIMIIYSYQLLGTTLVHPLASTGAIPVPSTGAIPVPSTGATPVPSTGATPVPSTGAIPVPSTGAIPVPSTGATPIPSTGAIPVPSTGPIPVAVGILMCSLKIIYILLGSTEEAIDATVACKVLSDNISTIIKSQINLPSVIDYLIAKEIVNDVDKKRIMALINIDNRWRELLDLVQATIELDEEVFLIFLDAIKDGNTRREKMLADKLYKVINMLYIVSI